MEKWFIIQDNSHLGPYDEESLHQMYQTGQIDDETFVWCSKIKEQASYGDIFLAEEELKEIEIDLFEDELPPELPTSTQSSNAPEKEYSLEGPLKETQAKVRKKFKSHFLFLGFFFLAILSFWGVYQYQGHTSLTRPSGMKLKDYADALSAIKNKENFFALSKDRKKIFFFSPYKGELLLGIKLESIVKESLSQNSVVATTSSKLKNHLAVIKDFSYLKGDYIVEGEYLVEINTLETKKIPFPYSLFHKEKQIEEKQKILLTNLSVDAFQKEKDRFWKSIRANEAIFWQDLSEQYKTLSVIIVQIKESLENVFVLSSSLAEAVKRFEKNYKEKFGMFFTSFVISNDKNTQKLAARDFPDKATVLGHYSHLSRLAKSVGSETMEILQDLETYQDYSNLNETDIKTKSLERLQKLLEEANNKNEMIRTKYLE